MKRLRAFASLLACLAVLAGGAMAVAAAAVPFNAAAAERSVADAPCSHCDQCDAIPCPMPSPSCVQATPSSVSTLAASSVDLPRVGYVTIRWATATSVFRGLSPPPDPFPPRA